ncbi:hypothetical protein HNE_1634 [Hyphomonas neptunium ATCC 15444]|uniref:Zinc-ribbon domain-containing protein n=2 Tax=Hyphomonas TaxID=85 RepID=Q0C1Q1_HYPNA|nr:MULTISPECIES: zinc ribbon domain-containing protein [Hyphomonas]ABI77583.1 hypothetical protein HNE_1634 [Hyphomonas neptunium ATCC 15444]KCZ92574.1 hypothetical protein HHI_11361 [Hyphomonas hirschiana VP5]
MASMPLVLTDPNLLAEFVREAEFKTFFEKRFATPPDLAALLFKNGQLMDSFQGAHFSVGGLANAIKGVVGGSTHIAILLADLKPFQVSMSFEGVSRDNVEVAGLCTFDLQLNPDKPSNILGLMRGVARNEREAEEEGDLPGRKALSTLDVLERIAPHVSDRVLEAVISRTDAADIRGNTGMQDKIQADMMKEAERVLGDLGVLVRAVSVEWALNKVEIEAFKRAQIARDQDALDYQLGLLKREMSREADATQFKLETSADLAKVQNATDDELAMMVLESEVRFLDAREAVTRRHEMEVLAHEVEILRTERAAKMENEIADAGHLIDLTKEASRLRKTEIEIEDLDARHVQNLKKMGVMTDLELNERRQRMELEIARLAQEQAAKNLETMMKLEAAGDDRAADRGMRVNKSETENKVALMKAEADARTAQLMAGSKMSPEQILAINAGLSPHVAEVLKEQARAQSSNSQESMEIMRELIKGASDERAVSRQHELDILKAGMTGATGVAHGAGGKEGGAADTSSNDAAKVDCPKCGRSMPAKANFCTGCGHKMRT